MSPETISLVALVIALTSTVTSYILLRLERYPEIIVYAAPDLRRPAVINLVLKNMGTERARDVRFVCSRKIPARAFGLEDAPKPGYMTGGPLINGISSFDPGAKEVITWGQYGGLIKGLGDDFLEVASIYYSRLPFSIGRRKHEKISRVDLRAFERDSRKDESTATDRDMSVLATNAPQGQGLEIFRIPPPNGLWQAH